MDDSGEIPPKPEHAETTLVFFVNGKKVVENNPDPEWSLLWYLRRKLHLTGSKYGCGEGGCGACTVMISSYSRKHDTIKHVAVNACLTPVCAMHGVAVTTVEGIGNVDHPHPVQERIAMAHGSQCGFCTPGIVMSMYALLRSNSNINYNDIETSLQGNLCRCTGYRPIIESFKTFIEGNDQKNCPDGINLCGMGKDCCKVRKEEDAKLFQESAFKPYDPTQEPIFPPELKLNDTLDNQYLYFKGSRMVWIRPTTLDELLFIKKYYPQSKIVGGNTEVGIEIKFKNYSYPIIVSLSNVPELKFSAFSHESVLIGAALTLSDIEKILHDIIKTFPKKSGVLRSFKQMLEVFAGSQIRNVATLAGNVITASPISDLNPILMASSSSMQVCSKERGTKVIPIDQNFFLGYRKTAVKNDEVVMFFEIPFSEERQFFKAYKQSRRKDDDISIVTAAFNVILERNSNRVIHAKLCFGGMGPKTIFAEKTSEALVNLNWDYEMVKKAYNLLNKELQLDSCVPGGMPEYRKTMCLSFFFKFYCYVSDNSNIVENLPRNVPKCSQYFEIIDKNRKSYDVVGKPIPHVSALKQATGEAIYCDDIAPIQDELYLKLILSTESHAKIKSIDASKALAAPDVVAFFSAKDLDPECNKLGPIFKDEEIFASELVTSRSCIIGAIIAKTESAANKAKRLVKVTYEKLQPVIVSIEDAIKYKSYFDGYPTILKKGDANAALAESKNIVEGYMRSGAQEHFYLETISALALRKEDELEIFATTQNPTEITTVLSQALKLPKHKIVSKVKRIGGGFGGKETRTTILAVPVGIAAYKLKKAVRSVLDRDEDMQVSGYRHPFLIKYQAAFTDYGKIVGVVYELYANAGNSMDISCAMIGRAVFHVDNCYFIPNIEVRAYLCKTNMPSNTAFRGFGAPQAMLAAECMIRDIAVALGKSYEEIVQINMYQEGSLTHFNQKLTHCTLSRCWNECIEISNYCERKKQIDEFNKSSAHLTKGIAITPTKYGISFAIDVLMQAGALLHVYDDGTALLSIGGIEMGQGLFTKMLQVASRALEIDISKIHLSEMSTDKVPNSSPTAASVSSDLYGMAVLDACKAINERIQPFKDKNPNGTWEDWITSAYVNRVGLSVTGFYAAPKMTYDHEKNCGDLYEYFTYGVACSEVIVDHLTGEHQVLRTDIVMDVGESLNPAIDIGQIEGAFTQGYGYYTMEEMVFSPSGEVLSRGPGTYKIPGFGDIPREFNVSLLKGAPNPRAVYSSKAIGEPPLFLAASVYFAIKEAINFHNDRVDSKSSPIVLETPATCARIKMACKGHIAQSVIPEINKRGEPWNVTA